MTVSKNNSPKKCHLMYAAVHQDKESYVAAVKIHYISSVLKLIVFGVIIFTSKSELIPILKSLSANL